MSEDFERMTPAQLQQYWATELRWGWNTQSRLVFAFLQEAAAFAKGGVILDAGAGHQRYRPFFDECIYLTQEHPAGIEFKRMQGITYDLVAPIDERIPLADESLDAIVNTSVVEHVRYPERFFAESHRVLRPGGRLFIHVPFAYPEHEAPYDFQRPTRYGLVRWLEDAGFEQISVRPASSSSETAMAFLESAIAQDLFRGTPIGKGAGAREAWAWFRQRPFQFLGKAMLWIPLWGLARTLSVLVRSFVDRGPGESTTFPVGWIAVATKGGTQQARAAAASKQEFLREYADA